MLRWKELGSAWNIVREIDIDAIREESEHPFQFACIGQPELRDTLSNVLYRHDNARFGPVGVNPLKLYTLPLDTTEDELRGADMLLLAVDGRQPLPDTVVDALKQLDTLALPLIIYVFYANQMPGTASNELLTLSTTARAVPVPDPHAADAADTVAAGLLTWMPAELRLAVGRRLPGVRAILAQELIQNTSFSNATYSLVSSLPEQIPLLKIPFATADMLVLTKNQTMLVYKLALAHGAPPDFQTHMREILPVLGGAYIWRQVARSLVGLIPVWGAIPKVAVAYAGTYTTGMVARHWYTTGELVSSERIKQLSEEGLQMGREWSQKMREQARAWNAEAQTYVQQRFTQEPWWQPGRARPGATPFSDLPPPPE